MKAHLYIFTTIYHNVSNQSETQNDDAEDDRGGADVFGNVRRLIITRVLVRREISVNALIVQRRQQFYVLAGTRKVLVFNMREVEQKLGHFEQGVVGARFG